MDAHAFAGEHCLRALNDFDGTAISCTRGGSGAVVLGIVPAAYGQSPLVGAACRRPAWRDSAPAPIRPATTSVSRSPRWATIICCSFRIRPKSMCSTSITPRWAGAFSNTTSARRRCRSPAGAGSRSTPTRSPAAFPPCAPAMPTPPHPAAVSLERGHSGRQRRSANIWPHARHIKLDFEADWDQLCQRCRICARCVSMRMENAARGIDRIRRAIRRPARASPSHVEHRADADQRQADHPPRSHDADRHL